MEPRKASVALLYNGKNATAQVSPYLASFTYTDVSSGSSDTINIELNDRDRKWIGPWFPQTGDRLKPTIRTTNWDADNIKTSFLCGAFCVDDFSFKGNPIKMSLDGVAIPATSSFKSTKRTQTYEKTNLKEIGQKVAERAGIALFYEAKEMTIEKVEQNNQDDCSFYNSLVTKYGLAMKIFNDRLVIFDEATANVDPENEDQLQKAMEALTREKTVLMIAHRLKTVRSADQILVLDQGRIVQRGTHRELIGQEGIYRNFVTQRAEAGKWSL